MSPRRRIVTERDVRRARRGGASSLDVADAVVTPSARDVARTLGVELRAGGPPKDHGTAAEPKGRNQKRAAASTPSPAAAPPAAATPAPAPKSLTIALGADHGGVALKAAIAEHLGKAGHRVVDLGTNGADAVDYPDFSVAVAREVAAGRAALGVMVDGAGIGSCMAANKVPGVRAAMCYDVTTAANAREHNHANLLTLGGGLIGTRLALAIVDTFLATPFAGGRHQARVDKIDALDRR